MRRARGGSWTGRSKEVKEVVEECRLRCRGRAADADEEFYNVVLIEFLFHVRAK